MPINSSQTSPLAGTIEGTTLSASDFVTGPGGPLTLRSGDSISVYRGSELSPTFLCAITWDNHGWVTESFSDASRSALPPGLVNGRSAVALQEEDNGLYTGGC